MKSVLTEEPLLSQSTIIKSIIYYSHYRMNKNRKYSTKFVTKIESVIQMTEHATYQ